MNINLDTQQLHCRNYSFSDSYALFFLVNGVGKKTELSRLAKIQKAKEILLE